MSDNKFAIRLRQAMNLNNIRSKDLCTMTGIDKSSISSYLSGRYKASGDNLHSISKALDISEAWLLGYDTNISNSSEEQNKVFDELDILYSKHKDILTDEDKEYMEFIIRKRMKEIDKQTGGE